MKATTGKRVLLRSIKDEKSLWGKSDRGTLPFTHCRRGKADQITPFPTIVLELHSRSMHSSTIQRLDFKIDFSNNQVTLPFSSPSVSATKIRVCKFRAGSMGNHIFIIQFHNEQTTTKSLSELKYSNNNSRYNAKQRLDLTSHPTQTLGSLAENIDKAPHALCNLFIAHTVQRGDSALLKRWFEWWFRMKQQFFGKKQLIWLATKKVE